MNVFKLSVATLIAASFTNAFAQESKTGLFLEPGVGYQVNASNVDYSAGFSNSTASTRGFTAILRGGVHIYESFFIAADARYSLLKFNDNSNNTDSNGTSWDIAPTVGMQMPDVGVRLYGGYVLAGNLDPDSANGFDLMFEEANGWRVGAGLKVENVSVNIEWQTLNYGSASLRQNGTSVSEDVDYNANGLVASVTFPFEFH